MNKKGSALVGTSIGVMVFLIGILTINFLKSEVTNTQTTLNCDGAISDGTKIVCLGTDLTIPYIIVTIISLSTAWFIGRVTS